MIRTNQEPNENSPSAGTAAIKVDDAASAAEAGAERAADTTKHAADTMNSAVHSAVKGVETGRQAVVQASGQVAATTRTAMTAIAHRKRSRRASARA